MVHFLWANCVFVLFTSITLPLYLLILIAIWWRPKLSLFHTLMLSQGVADIFSIVCYDFLIILPNTNLFDDFFWQNRYLLANSTIVLINYSLYLRYIGITLISLHRYIALCQNGRKIEYMVSRIPPVGFLMIHWLSPLLITVPLLTSFNATYTPEIKFMLPDNLMAVINILSIISVMISFIICVFCYVPVLLFMLRNRKSVNRIRQNDVRMSIQVAGLLIAFLLIFIYNVGNYVMLYLIGINQIGVLDVLQWWGMIYPLMNAFLCCVLPWTSLLLNHDIQIRLKAMAHCRKAEVVNSSLFVSRASAEISQRFLR